MVPANPGAIGVTQKSEIERWAIERHKAGKPITVKAIINAGFYDTKDQVRNALKRSQDSLSFKNKAATIQTTMSHVRDLNEKKYTIANKHGGTF